MDTARNATEPDRDFMAGLGKGLAVIECFDDRHQRLTIAEVAVMTRLSRAAARRCLLTLTRLGYVGYDGKFFRLTPRILRLGYAYLAATELPHVLQPVLERLSEQVLESCSASVLDGDEIIYIARSAKKRIMAVDLSVGSRLPAFCTSMGRVLLAALAPEEAARRIAGHERRRATPFTKVDGPAILDAIVACRTRGYAVIDQELEVGLVSIAVPVIDSAGATVAAINISAQSARIPAAGMAAHFLVPLNEAQAALRSLVKG